MKPIHLLWFYYVYLRCNLPTCDQNSSSRLVSEGSIENTHQDQEEETDDVDKFN